MDRHDAGMIEAGQDVGFARDSGRTHSLLIGDIEHLDRDVPAQYPVVGHVDRSHAAAAGDTRDGVTIIQLRPSRGRP